MGTFESFRKAYGALKDSTKVGLAKVNSEFKDLDIAIVKATNHEECPPKERHIRKILSATSSIRPRADVAYCIHALSRRLSKTRNWIVAIKTLIVFHRTLREGDPTFREELLHYTHRGHVFQISTFKDDSTPLAWDCSAWVRTYALFLEERLECFRTLKYDIETDRLTKPSPGGVSKVYNRTQLTNCEELLVQLPALQQFLYRLLGCQPEGAAYHNYLIQYALALVLKESFKIYCAINDRIINLVDMYFDMSKHEAVKALNIYKRAWQQAEHLADFYEFCKHLDLARNFQFPILRQPPHSFLATMEEYIKEAPQIGSASSRRLEYQEAENMKESDNIEEPSPPQEQVEAKEEEEEEEVADKQDASPEIKNENEVPPLIATHEPVDLLGLNEVNQQTATLEESNSMALAIFQPGNEHKEINNELSEIRKASRWELALVTTPSNNNNNMTKTNLAGGFDKLLLDSLYEDEAARRQLQLQNAGYNTGATGGYNNEHNNFDDRDPFFMSNSVAPPTNIQRAMMQQQQMTQQQQQQHHQNMMMVPYQNQPQYHQQQLLLQQMPYMGGSSNPFGDPFSYPERTIPPHPHGNNSLL